MENLQIFNPIKLIKILLEIALAVLVRIKVAQALGITKALVWTKNNFNKIQVIKALIIIKFPILGVFPV